MDERRRLALIVGLFVIVALGFAAASIFTLGSRSGLLADHYRLVTYFDNVQGLVAGGPVRLAGKDVGTVEFVTFAPLEADLPAVRVVLRINEQVRDRIRTDSVASIGTIGLLGDKYVEIQMGTPEGRVLEAGDELASVSPIDYTTAVERGTRAIDNIAELTENVNEVVKDFGEAMGGRRIAEATADVTDMLREVREGEGLLHSLVYDSYEGEGVESIEASLATLEDILTEVAEGDGLLHQLIYDPVSDEEDPVSELTRAARRLQEVLAKIDRGEGTLGLLVNDPSLYEDLRTLLGGAQRSFVVRSLIRLSTED
jgi:phospholipid/cholesterol/gamma-HCH transport system substrate-binding protein